ncbi:hypothetical protein AB4144_46005, partial [Rhizobiaceae sp. 2RAB30]
MTVPSEVSKSGPYLCNGVTDVFNYGFRVLDERHIRVVLANVAGAESDLTLNTHYTVSGVGNPTGIINLTSAGMALAVAGAKLTNLRNPPFTQNTDLQNQGAYYAEVVEDAFDLSTMQIQALKERVNRSIAVPVSSGLSADELTAMVLAVPGYAAEADASADVAEAAKDEV